MFGLHTHQSKSKKKMWRVINCIDADSDSQEEAILLSDDESTVQRQINRYFVENNISVAFASDVLEFDRHFCATRPSVIIFDIPPGGDNRKDLLQQIRSASDVPIIMIGHRHDEIDRVVGLELGADDCIAKPFSLRELLARVRAVLRRHEMGRLSRARDRERGGYRFNGWQLERRLRRVIDPDGNLTSLTKSEYALLLAFLEKPRRPLTREQLLRATQVHVGVSDRSVDVQVMRLRRKLDVDASMQHVIQTERGVGYVFAATVEPF